MFSTSDSQSTEHDFEHKFVHSTLPQFTWLHEAEPNRYFIYSLRTLIARWLNASQRSQHRVRLTTPARERVTHFEDSWVLDTALYENYLHWFYQRPMVQGPNEHSGPLTQQEVTGPEHLAGDTLIIVQS